MGWSCRYNAGNSSVSRIIQSLGVIVTDVKEGSPADDVGIQPQDVILQVNRVKIASKKDYLRELSRREAKQNILVLVKRGSRPSLFQCSSSNPKESESISGRTPAGGTLSKALISTLETLAGGRLIRLSKLSS